MLSKVPKLRPSRTTVVLPAVDGSSMKFSMNPPTVRNWYIALKAPRSPSGVPSASVNSLLTGECMPSAKKTLAVGKLPSTTRE
ncbi:hypothetical protein D3C83_38910 [compost metagenome]